MFFGGALLMRFLGPLFLKKIKPAALFIAFGCASAVLMLIALSTTNFSVINTSVIVSGFLQGSNLVAVVIICCDCFQKRTASKPSNAKPEGSESPVNGCRIP